MKKLLLALPLILLAGHLILELVFRHVIPYAMLKPSRTIATVSAESSSFPLRTISVKTDSVLLKGFIVEPKYSSPKAIIILIHGIAGNKSHFLATAEGLAREGYAALAFDLRAHGESSGYFTTYGYYEKYDVRSVVDYILSEKDS
ncbi:MAG: alpha/beta fold hydrolase, partial [Bacteroidota bacterium]